MHGLIVQGEGCIVSANKLTACLLLAGLLAAMLAGCNGGKAGKGSFDDVLNGMTEAEVEELLGTGKPDAGTEGDLGPIVAPAKTLRWTDEDEKITVTFVNGKVVAKTRSPL